MKNILKKIFSIVLSCIILVLPNTALAANFSAPIWNGWGDLAAEYSGINSIVLKTDINEEIEESGVYLKSNNNSFVSLGASGGGGATIWLEDFVSSSIHSMNWQGDYNIYLFSTSDINNIRYQIEQNLNSIVVSETKYKITLQERTIPYISSDNVMDYTLEHGSFGVYTEKLTVNFTGTFESGWYLCNLSHPNNTNDNYMIGGHTFWLFADENGKFRKIISEEYGEDVVGIPNGEPQVELRKVDATISDDGLTQYISISPSVKFTGKGSSDTSEIDQPNIEETSEYIYDQTDKGESLTIPNVNDVTTETEAVNKVQTAVNKATNEQKQSATGIDKLTLLAEEAAAKANTVKLIDNNVSVTSENIKTNSALQATTNVLTSANIQMQRKARNIVNYDLGDAETVNIKTEDISNKVDAVRVSTSYSSATVNANTASDFTMTNRGEKTVEINFNKDTDTTVTISFPNMNENDKYYAVVDENGNPIGGKYNPATGTLEAKLSESGIYKVVNNEKDFSDIKDKSAEMQEAIKVLASKGIINGTTATTFAPDSTISRAEVTALLMRTISLLDPNANGNFADVNTSNWYCGAAGSAKEHNIINGYEDNTFRGNTVIAKDQIVAVSARTLKQQMNYKTPSDVASELSVYADANNIANWAKEDVALATMTNLVLKRTDSTFSGSDGMTRGDTATIMQRLFNKLW